ncbi:MAG TPA: GIY-YIG nuclease family protein [Terracidiphilus sp.]
MLIRNFGHLWERKYINYGTGGKGNSGHLKGYINKKREANFRDQIGIYVLYDKDLVPVYVGQAGNGRSRLLRRLNQHETDDLWNRWEYFSWFGFRRVNAKGTLNAFDDVTKKFGANGNLLLNEVEGALITALEPKLNKQGARWKDVKEYFQTRDPELEEATLGDLVEKFNDLEELIQKVCTTSSTKSVKRK